MQKQNEEPRYNAVPVKIPKQTNIAEFTRKNAEKLYESLKPFIGKQMILFGGGGPDSDLVVLKNIILEPQVYYDRADIGRAQVNPTDVVKEYELGYENKPVETIRYHPKNRYAVKVTLELVGDPKPFHSLFTETEWVGENVAKHKKIDFTPSLGSWQLAELVEVKKESRE